MRHPSTSSRPMDGIRCSKPKMKVRLLSRVLSSHLVAGLETLNLLTMVRIHPRQLSGRLHVNNLDMEGRTLARYAVLKTVTGKTVSGSTPLPSAEG